MKRNNKILVFCSTIIGIVIGVILSHFGFIAINKYFESAFSLIAITLIVALIFIVVLLIFKDKIFEKLLTKFKTELVDLENNIAGLAKSILNKNADNITTESSRLIKYTSSKYFSIKYNQWLTRIAITILLAFTALFGSFLLFKQNELIDKQNHYFQKQNESLNQQFKEQMNVQNENRKVDLYSILYESTSSDLNELKDEFDSLNIVLQDHNDDNLFIDAKINKVNFRLGKSFAPLRENSLRALIEIEKPDKTTQLNLEESLLNDLDITDLDLTNCNLNNSNLSRSKLNYNHLYGKSNNGIAFVGSRIMNPDSTKFEIDSLVFEACLFYDTDFGLAKITDSNFSGCLFSMCSFEDDVLSNFELINTSFSNCVFNEGLYGNVTFTDVTFWPTTFINFSFGHKAILNNVTFLDCSFYDCDFLFSDESLTMNNVKLSYSQMRENINEEDVLAKVTSEYFSLDEFRKLYDYEFTYEEDTWKQGVASKDIILTINSKN